MAAVLARSEAARARAGPCLVHRNPDDTAFAAARARRLRGPAPVVPAGGYNPAALAIPGGGGGGGGIVGHRTVRAERGPPPHDAVRVQL
jgi:hypothetical protein